MGDDPNFATTTANNISTKAPINNPTLTGVVELTGDLIKTDTGNNVGYKLGTAASPSGRTFLILDSDASDGVGAGSDYTYIGSDQSFFMGDLTMRNGTITATNFSGNGSSITNVDAVTVDGLDSTQFLRSDVDDDLLGNIRFYDNSIEHGKLKADGDLYLGTTTPIADWDIRDNSGNAFFALDRASGEVGIGTADPTAKLDVNGNIAISNASSPPNVPTNFDQLYLGDRSQIYNRSGLGLSISTNNEFGGSPAHKYQVNGSAGLIEMFGDSFKYYNAGAGTAGASPSWINRFTILAGGNVGIGTDNPDRTLHIHSPDVGPLKIHSTNTNGSYIRLSDPNTTASPNHVWIGAQGNDTKFFQSNSLLSMIIKSDGDVGIGYDSPASKLDVRGELGANGTAATPTAYFVNRQSGATSGSIYIGASTGIDWKIGKNVTGIANNQNFSIADSSNNRRLDIDATGRVGINNTSPQGVLSIHGGTGTSYSEVESLNGVNFYKFFKVIDTARSLQMENIFIMPALSNGQKYIHFVTTKDGAMGFDLDILCGRSGSERMFGRVSLRGYKYHESDGDYRHGAIESTSSINAYGNYFEINGPVTQYLADSANATQESYSNPGNYWITRIPCYFNGGGSGQVEFTAFLKTMHHNTAPAGTYYMGIV